MYIYWTLFGCRARWVSLGLEAGSWRRIQKSSRSESSRAQWIGVNSSSCRCNMEVWTYGLGKGWLVRMKQAARDWVDSRFDQVGCSTGPAMHGSHPDGEKGQQQHRQRIESIVGSIKSAARQVQLSSGSLPGWWELTLRRAGSSTDRES